MPNVVAIIQDDRVRRQCEQFLQELGMDDLRFATFKTHQEFTKLYWRDRQKQAKEETKPAETPGENPAEKPAEKPPEDDGADLKLFSEIHLVIFALDSVGEKSATWIDKLKVNFKKFGYWPQKQQLRMVILKYEDDGISKLDILHPLLDDLIYLPLDRLVFLQKTQIILALPKRIKPKFLFNQEVKRDIEISKISKMDRLSDVGLAIRNPIPLRKGLPGHFYIMLPTEKARLEIRAKVFKSEPHPDYPGQYLVYFTYFGLNKADLSKLRQFLSKAPRYQSLYSDDRSLFRFKPDDIFMTAGDNKNFGIVVIDMDELAGNNLASQMTKDMDRLKVSAESSYQVFLQKYLEAGSGTGEKSVPKPTEAADFYQTPLTLTVQVDGLRCLAAIPGPGDADSFLGHPAKEIFSSAEKWISLLTDKGTRLVAEESAQFAVKGREIDKILSMNDASGIRRAVRFTFRRGGADHLVSIELNSASLADIVEKNSQAEQNKDLDALVLESSFMPDEPASWIEALRSRAVQSGFTKETAPVKFFVVADNDSRAAGSLLNCPDVLGLFVKPVDTRQLQFLLSEYLPNKHTVYQFDNLGWAQPGLSVHVSKSVQLEALSEFGATLKSRQPLAPGTMIYLRKSIYENAPNACLAARVYACEQHQSEKEFFQVYATYFGINDQFLKFARTWIRENYAHQKGKET